MKTSSVILFSLLCSFIYLPAFAQQKNLPLNRDLNLNPNREICKVDSQNIFSNFKPLIESKSFTINRLCGFRGLNWSGNICTKGEGQGISLFRRKLNYENLIIVRDSIDKFHLTLDPLFNFEYGKDLEDDSSTYFYKNTRGILVRGDIGSKFSFESSFYENQATFVDYISNFNDTYKIVPGQGRWKKFKANGYDFAMASGYISYSPGRHFNFQVGHGKHFVGDGYRSLLLSDNAFNYPFARITSTFGKFQYTNLYTSFMNLNYGGVSTPAGTEPLFQKKSGNFQFLSWNAAKRLQIGLFQGLIWQASDSTNKQCLKLAYASPIIYSAAATEGLGGNNNVVLGSTFKLKITSSISTYGQIMADDLGFRDKIGLQLGVKYFDLFRVKNLHIQFEGNTVNGYSYAASKPSQSYTHYNQALAHPLGANFKEAITFINYRIGDFFTQFKFNYALCTFDLGGYNYGNDIFISDQFMLPVEPFPVDRELRIIDFHIGYLVNPSTNFNIVAGIMNRSSISPVENKQTNFIYFGIRTSLTNTYYDF